MMRISRGSFGRNGKEFTEPSSDDFYHLYQVEDEVGEDLKQLLWRRREHTAEIVQYRVILILIYPGVIFFSTNSQLST